MVDLRFFFYFTVKVDKNNKRNMNLNVYMFKYLIKSSLLQPNIHTNYALLNKR